MSALMVMTDGRLECITRTIPSVLEQLGEHAFEHAIIHDDSADPEYRAALRDRFPSFTIIGGRERRGFGRSVRAARLHLLTLGIDWAWWQEDDFVITRPVDLDAMQRVLLERPYLAQLALLRQPVNATERAAGGVIQQHPESYELVTDGVDAWREHRRHFTTNPSIVPARILERYWSARANSEGLFGVSLFREPGWRSAYWGAEGEWCEHIGHTRAGTGY